MSYLEGHRQRLRDRFNTSGLGAFEDHEVLELLLTYAVRRTLDNGAPLGYLAEQLRLRFGATQPQAVATVVSAAQAPVTIDNLRVELIGLSPALLTGNRDTSFRATLQRELSQLFVLRRDSGPALTPEQRLVRAQALVEATVDMFVNTGAIAKKRDAADAGRFIEDQIRGYEAQLTEAESRLKEFRIRNFGVSGVSNQDYFARVSSLTEQVGKLRIDLTSAERSRDSYRRELALEDPQLPATVLAAGATEVEVRLLTQKNQLDELLRRFTEAHPDVISARRIVTQLEAEAALAQAAQARTGYRGGQAATSPIYQKLRLSLAQADADVAALQSQLSTQSVQLAEVRALAGRVPQVEAEHAQLNRDYDVVRKSYDAMVARRESAALGVKLDATSQLAEFRVVEPPRVSPVPVFPARLHWAALALLASVALGIAAAVVAELLSPTFEETTALRQLSGRPVLGTVSVLMPAKARIERQRSTLKFASVLGLAVALQAMWVGWIAVGVN